MAILVFEGSNKVGKTTLINAIQKHCEEHEIPCCLLNERVAKNAEIAVTPECMFDTACEHFSKMLIEEKAGNLVLVERFHLTELVYGKIYRGYTNYGMLDIDTLLSAAKVKLIAVTSAYKHITEPFENWKLNKLQDEMVMAFGSTDLNKLRIHFVNADKNELSKAVTAVLKFAGV